jgi:hypothetical protein
LKARAISSPMPAAPAVTRTRRPLMPSSISVSVAQFRPDRAQEGLDNAPLRQAN